MNGTGDVITSRQNGLGAAQVAAQAASAATAAASSGFSASAMLAAAGGPIGIAIGVGSLVVTALISKWLKTGKQKVYATNVVNQVEPMMQQNLAEYLASARTQSVQAEAMNNFHALWNVVLEKCGAPGTGSAGERCISERREGARPPWGKNWFELYLDPIRNDVVQVTPGVETRTTYNQQTGQPVYYTVDTNTGEAVASGAGVNVMGVSLPWWLLAAGGVVAAALVFGEGKKKGRAS